MPGPGAYNPDLRLTSKNTQKRSFGKNEAHKELYDKTLAKNPAPAHYTVKMELTQPYPPEFTMSNRHKEVNHKVVPAPNTYRHEQVKVQSCPRITFGTGRTMKGWTL